MFASMKGKASFAANTNRKETFTLLYPFLRRKSLCSKNRIRQNSQISNLQVIYAQIK